jgi:hypothetical protein
MRLVRDGDRRPRGCTLLLCARPQPTAPLSQAAHRLLPSDANVASAAALISLLSDRHGKLIDGLAREVPPGTGFVCVHSRAVVRPGGVLLGGVGPNLPWSVGLSGSRALARR